MHLNSISSKDHRLLHRPHQYWLEPLPETGARCQRRFYSLVFPAHLFKSKFNYSAMGMHSASTVLDDIIDELRLKYDSSSGLLDGDAVREIPSLNMLQNLSKLLSKLSKSLDSSEEKDKVLLTKIESRIPKEDGDTDAGDVQNTAEIEEDEKVVKRERPDADIEDESIPLAKRRKQTVEEDDGDSNAKGQRSDDVPSVEVDAEEKESGSALVNAKDDPVPPVQNGSYTQNNDTRLKNPKSEFVSSQTLSASAVAELGLFSEENNGLETQGVEYLKRKYGVASYPENDLKSMLPGEIPNIDFSKTKAPSNQVQFTTYQSYIESYFRPFSNEDITFINEKNIIPPGMEKNYDPQVSPYLIPKLGPFYTEAWAEEDAALGSKLSSPSFQRPPLEAYKPKGDADGLVDENLLTEDVSCGPLSNRLLSAILSIHEVKDEALKSGENDEHSETPKNEDSILGANVFPEDAASQLNAPNGFKESSENNDFYSMEERLKRELKYIGIFMNLPNSDDGKPKKGTIIDSDDWILNREDDEVCAEMRALQEQLKGAVVRNRKRKRVLGKILEEQLAYQEYCTIAEDLDKQVDQAYLRRLKAKSKKKKLAQENNNVAQQQAANSGLRSLLEKRTRWLTNIGKLFPPPEVMKRIPSKSIFDNSEQSDDEEGEAEVDVVATDGA